MSDTHKKLLWTGLAALAAVAIVAYVQRNVYPIPVVGGYLPK